jgi:hypothetical protein
MVPATAVDLDPEEGGVLAIPDEKRRDSFIA